MTKLPRDDDGLTPQESRAAVLRATGMSQAEAWRQAFNRPRVKPQTAWTEVSVGQWGEMVLEGARDAREAGNWPAFANLTRQLGQAVGALKDSVSMTMESSLSDEDLIQRMADGDPATLAALQQILGVKEGFDA